MPADQAVTAGVLPNGLSYYIVSNTYEKGLADFALIQKTGTLSVPDSLTVDSDAVKVARQALTSLPRLKNDSPQDFFIRHGAVPGRNGYVSVSEDATVFRFPGVRLSDHKAVLDSALVVLLDIADRGNFSDNPFLNKWYASADQAITVTGGYVPPKAQVTVTDFGAVPDDGTDDTVAIQKAMDSLKEGGAVYFLKGVYTVGRLILRD